ncbi:MAG: hypothetical protein IKP28_03460 [Clostridia bacterium]|nr:hypothetical protein [Clostridia bacterium]
MKKKIALITSLILIFTVGLFILTGCGETKEQTTTTSNAQSTQKTESTAKAETTNTATTNSKGYKYTYKDGVLTQIVDEEGKPKQTDFVIDGIILVGNRHSYEEMEADAEGIMAKLVQQGYKKTGINSSFYLNEYIEFYIDTKYAGSTNDVKILVTPHRTVEELEKMSLTKLEELANENGGFVINYSTPDVDEYKYVGNGYVNMDYPEGKYDILFTYKGKLAYFINITETKEPAE